MLSCKVVLLGISDYFAGKLPICTSEMFRVHLENCKTCPEITIMCGTVVLLEKPRP